VAARDGLNPIAILRLLQIPALNAKRQHIQQATHNEPRCIQAAAGLGLRLCEAICICADFRCEPTSAWPSRALSHDDIKLSGVAFRPGQDCGLLRRRDPTHAGVCCTVQVESSRLHCSGTNVLSKEGTFCFRPALVNNGGSFHMIRFFRACVNFFRYNSRPICRTIASSTLTGPGGIPDADASSAADF
jgi:hypothetical protein